MPEINKSEINLFLKERPQQGWGDGSVGKGLPHSHEHLSSPQHPSKKYLQYTPVTPVLEYRGGSRGLTGQSD